MRQDDLYLAGDIGGTKTVVGLFSTEQGPREPVALETYPSDDHASLEAIVTLFTGKYPAAVRRASFGVAGPVMGRVARITNLPWVVNADSVSAALGGAEVNLLNDLEAIANYVPNLSADEVLTLNTGSPVMHGAKAVIAPGTGLGEAFLVWHGGHYRAFPSEGGHTDFGPLDATQQALLAYLQPRLGHVSYEMVCSGMGLPNLYHFLKSQAGMEEPAWLAALVAESSDPTRVIVTAAQKDDAPALCRETMALFVAILGAEAGNLALKVMATGGVYVGGGIPPRIVPYLQQGGFMRAFLDKGRFGKLLETIPVYVILEPRAPLFGAASHVLGL